MGRDRTLDDQRQAVMVVQRLAELLEPEVKVDREQVRRVRALATREGLRAADLVEEILRVDPKVRQEEARADQRFHSYAVLVQILKRAQDEILHAPRHTRQLAELALAIIDAMWPSPIIPLVALRDLAGLAHGQIGNVYRLESSWQKAGERFNRAYDLLLHGSGDLEIHAQVHRMYGALLTDRHQFPEALAFLEMARDDYEALGLEHETGLALLALSILYREMKAPNRALQALMQSCERLDETKAPVLAAASWNNLAVLMCDLGRYEEATAVLDNPPSLFESLPNDSTVNLNLHWTRGMIAQGVGDLGEAVQRFSMVRDGYSRRGDQRSVALVSLDLLRTYFQQGRLTEVEELAKRVYIALKSQPLGEKPLEVLRILTMARAQQHRIEDALNRLVAFLAANHLPGQRSPAVEP